MRKQILYILIGVALLFLLVSSFSAGFIVRGLLGGKVLLLAQEVGTVSTPSLQPVEMIWNVLRIIKENYVEKIEDDSKLVQGAIKGMLESLGDPYSRFLDPTQRRMLQEESEGEFYGIGAQLGLRRIEVNGRWEDRVTIIAPLSGSPAERAGLKAGDYIIAVDGKNVKGLSVDEVASMIRGRKGTTVHLTIQRRGVSGELHFAIPRELIKIQPVESKMIDGIGYLKLQSFSENAPRMLKEAAEQLERQNAKGLILDLRNNPGGLFDSAIGVASIFVQENPIVIIQEKGGRRTFIPPQREFALSKQLPLVVLVNEGSASASEIVAGAIKDHRRGKLVGTRTFGKGLVQTVIPLEGGSAIALTTAKYLTPSGKDINKEGITPDIVFGPDESKYEFSWDGAILRWEKKYLRILYVSPQSPLFKEGLRENDLITQVEGKTVSINSLEEIANTLFDESRSTIHLRYLRGGKSITAIVPKKDIDIQLEKALKVLKEMIK